MVPNPGGSGGRARRVGRVASLVGTGAKPNTLGGSAQDERSAANRPISIPPLPTYSDWEYTPGMARVRFTRHLERYFEGLGPLDLDAGSVGELISLLERRHPGMAHYLLDDRGWLRKHVNVFVDGTTIPDRRDLSGPLRPDSEVHVMQALSGG